MLKSLFLSAALSGAPAFGHDDPWTPVVETCHDILYYAGELKARLSRADDGTKLRSWKERSLRYVHAVPRNNLFQARYERYWGAVLERHLVGTGLFKGYIANPDTPDDTPLFEVDRDALVARHPQLAAWLPEDYRLAFFPDLQITADIDAFVYRHAENILGLPIDLAWAPPSSHDLFRIQHEVGHIQRRRDRARAGDFTFSFLFVDEGPAPKEIETEEILVSTLSGVSYLKLFCAEPANPEAREGASKTLTRAWAHLQSYRAMVLPRLQRALARNERLDFDEKGRWKVAGLTAEMPFPRPAWDLGKARRWLKKESARVDAFTQVLDRMSARYARKTEAGAAIVPIPEMCGDIGTLEKLLGSLAPLARIPTR